MRFTPLSPHFTNSLDWVTQEGRVFNYFTYLTALSEVELDVLTGRADVKTVKLCAVGRVAFIIIIFIFFIFFYFIFFLGGGGCKRRRDSIIYYNRL